MATSNSMRTVTLPGRQLAAALVLALSVGFMSGWVAHAPPPPTDTAALLRAFEQVNEHAAQVISDAMRAGAAGSAPGAARQAATP